MKKQKNYIPVTKDDLTEALKNYPTKQDLADALKNYPTKKDLKDELSNYPTKKDLNNELNERFSAFHKAIRIENKHEFTVIREELKADLSKFTNLILTTLDPLLKELETRRQDREIAANQAREINIQLDDHEKRLKKLERS